MDDQGLTKPGMQECITACEQCHRICLRMAMTHCLVMGGKLYVEVEHFRLMMNCAEFCQTSANFMLSGSKFLQGVCALCAEVCEACAKSCEDVGGMDVCVNASMRCAESCRKMAGATH